MVDFRAEEPKCWEPPSDLNLPDTDAVRHWTRKLEVTALELEEVIERVSLSGGDNRSAVVEPHA